MILYNKKIFKSVFDYSGKYWYKNILSIPLYFRRIHFLIKNGYDWSAHWAVDTWFFDIIIPILKHYKDESMGTPILREDFPFDLSDLRPEEEQQRIKDENEKEWKEILQKMIDLARSILIHDDMYSNTDWKTSEEIYNYKVSEFFKLFSKYMGKLWD